MDAAQLRSFCHRQGPPCVIFDNMFEAPIDGAAVDALERDVGLEMSRAYGRARSPRGARCRGDAAATPRCRGDAAATPRIVRR